jgi:hypothetical protein
MFYPSSSFNIVIHPACVVFSILYNNNNNNNNNIVITIHVV